MIILHQTKHAHIDTAEKKHRKETGEFLTIPDHIQIDIRAKNDMYVNQYVVILPHAGFQNLPTIKGLRNILAF